MAGRNVSWVIGVVAVCMALTGCLLNTPDQVVKRFVSRLKARQWEAMAELVEWPRSSRYVPGLPSSNTGEDDAKREVMLRIAENFTGFPVRQRTTDQIRHEFLYLKLAGLKHMRDSDTWAWLEIRLTMDGHAKTVQLLVMKIDRVWRIVLTESIFK